MTDIEQRLTKAGDSLLEIDGDYQALCYEAADTISKLRADLNKMRGEREDAYMMLGHVARCSQHFLDRHKEPDHG